MDEYGQIGPEKPGYEEDVQAIGRMLGAGQPVEIEHAHRMTLTKLVLVPLSSVVRLNDRPRSPAVDQEAWFTVLVCALGKGSDWLPLYGDLHWTGVAEYFGISNEISATAIAQLLNHVSAALPRPVASS